MIRDYDAVNLLPLRRGDEVRGTEEGVLRGEGVAVEFYTKLRGYLWHSLLDKGVFASIYCFYGLRKHKSSFAGGGENCSMNVIVFINNMFSLANEMLDFVFLWGGLVLLFAYPVIFFSSNLKKYSKEHKNQELLTQSIILFLLVALLGLGWILPELVMVIWGWMRNPALLDLTKWMEWAWIFSSFRWILVFAGFYFFARLFGNKYGKGRWRYSSLGLFAIITLGWLLGRWMGIAFISAPMLFVYYLTLRDAALIIVPASNPEDKEEQKKRINALISYTWGTQSPMTVVDDHAWKNYEPRIPGDIAWSFSDFPVPIIKNFDRPGLIWTRSHQVATITAGIQFKRVEEPGVAFTGKMERLDQVFDLRLQLRNKEIEVVSKDGVHFLARFFTAFRIDNEEWSKELYSTLRPRNAILRGADKLGYKKGSFLYSNLRVQATRGVTSTKVTLGDPLIYWDQWAMNVIEDQTRKVISQKDLDELWRPIKDTKFANALDIIAREIRENSEIILRSAGILLVAARVVNFRFDSLAGENIPDDISKQQVATWGSEWERKRIKILAEAEADAGRAKQEARAYAESLQLDAIGEGLQKTHEMNPALPRYVIALRFLSALQEYIHKRPEDEGEGKETEENAKKRAELQRTFKTWQDLFFPEGK